MVMVSGGDASHTRYRACIRAPRAPGHAGGAGGHSSGAGAAALSCDKFIFGCFLCSRVEGN